MVLIVFASHHDKDYNYNQSLYNMKHICIKYNAKVCIILHFPQSNSLEFDGSDYPYSISADTRLKNRIGYPLQITPAIE